MDRDLAVLSKSIDPGVLGRRIRDARVAAGLTQTKLADGLASAAYFSRIEAGERRPGARLLEQIAERLRVPLEELLMGVTRDQAAEWQVEVDHAELALASGQADEALRRTSALLEVTDLRQLPDLLYSLQFVHALALEATGDASGAIHQLELLSAAEPQDVRWLRVLIALSRCYRYAGDLNRAIEVGERARESIAEAGLEGLGEAIQLSLTMAAAYFLRGDTAYAAEICRRAIDEAEAAGSPVSQASAYWNASVIESRRGNTRQALPLAQKALSVFEVGEDARNLARLRTQVAIMELRLNPPHVESARKSLETAHRELDWTSASPTDKADAMFAMAQVNFLEGDAAAAERLVSSGLDLVAGRAPLSAASALVLRGQIAVADGETDRARATYREAIAQLTAAGADRVAGELWFELAEALEQLGEGEDAKFAYRSAAAAAGLAVRAPIGTGAASTADVAAAPASHS